MFEALQQRQVGDFLTAELWKGTVRGRDGMISGNELYRQRISPNLALIRLQATDQRENDVADTEGCQYWNPDDQKKQEKSHDAVNDTGDEPVGD